ncbi:hypothetical protein Scep_002088 [Stephania cephalantha]|uniref:Uncharacterized protein n=1 Tax=Stephania cephalantha TaxID=152367 RepID=A0AAP0Q3Z9_9MAGN
MILVGCRVTHAPRHIRRLCAFYVGTWPRVTQGLEEAASVADVADYKWRRGELLERVGEWEENTWQAVGGEKTPKPSLFLSGFSSQRASFPLDPSTLDPLLSLTVIFSLTVTISLTAEKLGRPSTALELCLYFPTKDQYSVTFLDLRVEKIVMAIQCRRIELTQSQPDTPIDETELYLSVFERDNKGRTYGLGWTLSGSWRIHATTGGAGGGDGARSSRLISTPNVVELLWRDFQAMQTHILRVMQDHTLTQDQLREV